MNADSEAYKYLIGHYGSEDAAREKVEEYISQFDGLVTFGTGCTIKASEHGWNAPGAPALECESHLSDQWLEKCVEYSYYPGGKGYGRTSLTGEILAIGQVRMFEREDRDGNLAMSKSLDVTIGDEGWERTVRMRDLGAKRNGESEFPACYMLTLFDKLRAAVGRRIRLYGVEVRRVEDLKGINHYLQNGNFTRAKILEEAAEEEDLLDSEVF